MLPSSQTASSAPRTGGGLGGRVRLDFVGADSTTALAVGAVRPGGDVEIVDLADGSLPFTSGAVRVDATLSIPFRGTAIELMEVLELARQGQVRPHVERFPLERVDEAYARLREGSLNGHAVVCPHG
jgi:propanol-preferring alcohol dehydrogenase